MVASRKALRVVVFSVLTVLFGVGNNVTFFEMGQRMEKYPEFLLYFTTLCYTTLYLIGAVTSFYIYRLQKKSGKVLYTESASSSSSNSSTSTSTSTISGSKKPTITSHDDADSDLHSPTTDTAALPDAIPFPDIASVTLSINRDDHGHVVYMNGNTLVYGQQSLDEGLGDDKREGQDETLWEYFLAKKYQRTFAWLGFWLTVNGLFSQFSDPYVNGNLQSVLYQLTLPATGVLAYFMLRERFTALNLVGSMLVLGGCLMVALPPLIEQDEHGGGGNTTLTAHQDGMTSGTIDDADAALTMHAHTKNDWIWIIIFALSVIPNGVCAVLQEGLFKKHSQVNTMLLLFWSNFYTLVGYVLSLPLTMLPYLGNFSGKELAQNQHDAFLCLTNHAPLPDGCKSEAYVPVFLFVVCYMGFFLFLALLVKEVSAVFEALVNGVVTPASSVAFGMRWLVGSDFERLTGYVIAASVIVPVGVIVFKITDVIEYLRTPRAAGREFVVSDDERKPLLSAPKK